MLYLTFLRVSFPYSYHQRVASLRAYTLSLMKLGYTEITGSVLGC